MILPVRGATTATSDDTVSKYKQKKMFVYILFTKGTWDDWHFEGATSNA